MQFSTHVMRLKYHSGMQICAAMTSSRTCQAQGGGARPCRLDDTSHYKYRRRSPIGLCTVNNARLAGGEWTVSSIFRKFSDKFVRYAAFTICMHRSKVKGKGSRYSITQRIVFRSWSRFLAVSLQVTWVINPAVGCHYFPSRLQLPPQPLRGLLPISLLGEQRLDGCEQFA